MTFIQYLHPYKMPFKATQSLDVAPNYFISNQKFLTPKQFVLNYLDADTMKRSMNGLELGQGIISSCSSMSFQSHLVTQRIVEEQLSVKPGEPRTLHFPMIRNITCVSSKWKHFELQAFDAQLLYDWQVTFTPLDGAIVKDSVDAKFGEHVKMLVNNNMPGFVNLVHALSLDYWAFMSDQSFSEPNESGRVTTGEWHHKLQSLYTEKPTSDFSVHLTAREGVL